MAVENDITIRNSIGHFVWKLKPIVIHFKNKKDAENAGAMNHGYNDLTQEMPSWKEFFLRSQGLRKKYQHYMAYVLTRDVDEEVGVVAVQNVTVEEMNAKFIGVPMPDGVYLYLSWIGLEKRYQGIRLSKLLFSFYESLLKNFMKRSEKPVYGAIKAVRRMRPLLYLISCACNDYPTTIKDPFYFKGRQIWFVGFPGEMIEEDLSKKHDYYYIRLLTLAELKDGSANKHQNTIK